MKVKCKKCNHSWKREPNDTNPFLCHNCGFDMKKNKYDHAQNEKFWKKFNIDNKIIESTNRNKLLYLIEDLDKEGDIYVFNEKNHDYFDYDDSIFFKYLIKKNYKEIIFNEGFVVEDHDITRLPNNMTFEHDFIIAAENLEELPEGLVVKGDFIIKAPKVTSLPFDIDVSGFINAYGTSITGGTEDISVPIIIHKNYVVTIRIDLDESGDYLDVGRDYSKDIFGKIFGDDFEEWYSYDHSAWEEALYYVDDHNLTKIKELVKQYGDSISADLEDLEEHEEDSLEELINYLDFDELQSALNSAYSEAINDEYTAHLRKAVINSFEDLGKVTPIDYNTIELTVELDFTNFDYQDINQLLDMCGDDLKCYLNELLDNGIDKPRFDPDSRYQPSPDKENLNNILSDRLSDIAIN